MSEGPVDVVRLRAGIGPGPIYGCPGCSGTAGRAGCAEHAWLPLAPVDVATPTTTMLSDEDRASLARLEAKLDALVAGLVKRGAL